jgi:hypothetical protein
MLCIPEKIKDNGHYNDLFGYFGDSFVEAIGWLFLINH